MKALKTKLLRVLNPSTGAYELIDTLQGKDGEDGTSVSIKSVSESSASGGSNVVTFSDGTTMSVKNGKDGKTPQLGEDYWTMEEQLSMFVDVTNETKKYVDEAILGGAW